MFAIPSEEVQNYDDLMKASDFPVVAWTLIDADKYPPVLKHAHGHPTGCAGVVADTNQAGANTEQLAPIDTDTATIAAQHAVTAPETAHNVHFVDIDIRYEWEEEWVVDRTPIVVKKNKLELPAPGKATTYIDGQVLVKAKTEDEKES